MTRWVTVSVAGSMIRRRTSPQEPSEQLALAPILNSASAATTALPSGAAAGCWLHHGPRPNAPLLARERRVSCHPRVYGHSVALAISGCHRPVCLPVPDRCAYPQHRSPGDEIGPPGSSYLYRSPRRERVTMTEHAPPWPKMGPASYFPSIEKKYGRSIAEWQQIIAGCGLDKHMAVVGYLKSEHGMGHGHANALVGWTLAGNVASPSGSAA